jgi:hypothetical protein
LRVAGAPRPVVTSQEAGHGDENSSRSASTSNRMPLGLNGTTSFWRSNPLTIVGQKSILWAVTRNAARHCRDTKSGFWRSAPSCRKEFTHQDLLHGNDA